MSNVQMNTIVLFSPVQCGMLLPRGDEKPLFLIHVGVNVTLKLTLCQILFVFIHTPTWTGCDKKFKFREKNFPCPLDTSCIIGDRRQLMILAPSWRRSIAWENGPLWLDYIIFIRPCGAGKLVYTLTISYFSVYIKKIVTLLEWELLDSESERFASLFQGGMM